MGKLSGADSFIHDQNTTQFIFANNKTDACGCTLYAMTMMTRHVNYHNGSFKIK
jgi:hypothetical protein